MIEMFFLADVETTPCEVVEFVLDGEREEAYHAGIISHLFLRPTGTSTRFLSDRLYIATTSAFEERQGEHHEVGFLSERVVLVAVMGEESSKAKSDSGSDFVERIVVGGFFYPSRDLALERCHERDETS